MTTKIKIFFKKGAFTELTLVRNSCTIMIDRQLQNNELHVHAKNKKQVSVNQ